MGLDSGGPEDQPRGRPATTPGDAANLGVGIALLVLSVSPALVMIAVSTAVGVRTAGWRPPWLVLPIIGGMLVLAFGAAVVEAPRSAVVVAAASMLLLLLGLIGAATELRTAEARLASAAIVEQRSQVAADVHDIVSHTLSVTLLHLSAARMALPDDPDDALQSILDAEYSTTLAPERSDDLDGDAIGVGCERFEVGAIPGEHSPAGFGERDHERVDR